MGDHFQLSDKQNKIHTFLTIFNGRSLNLAFGMCGSRVLSFFIAQAYQPNKKQEILDIYTSISYGEKMIVARLW